MRSLRASHEARLNGADQGLIHLFMRRGLEILAPPGSGRDSLAEGLSPARREAFYERLKSYSFRLVLRDIIKHQDSFGADDLLRFCSLARVREHLRVLSGLGLIRSRGGRYRLVPGPVRSFGDTLEWFIAKMFEREFHAEALWGIRFRKGRSGGDYDVVARMGSELVYVEVKSSPPKHVEIRDVKGFLNRVEDLLPHLAIFFIDTELRMRDKLVPLFEDALRLKYGRAARRTHPVTRLRDELFQIRHRLFIVNSKRDVAGNFRECFRDFWRDQIGV